MNQRLSAVLFFAWLSSCSLHAAYSMRVLGNCNSNTDCPADNCCLLGRERYSVATCQPLRQLNEECRPRVSRPSTNLTLTYPNGIATHLADFYEVLCPCAVSLVCDDHHRLCIPNELPPLLDNDLTQLSPKDTDY